MKISIGGTLFKNRNATPYLQKNVVFLRPVEYVPHYGHLELRLGTDSFRGLVNPGPNPLANHNTGGPNPQASGKPALELFLFIELKVVHCKQSISNRHGKEYRRCVIF